MIRSLKLRALLLPPTPAGSRLDLSDAVRNVAGCTVRQALVSTVLIALMAGAAYAFHALVWLTLFVMLLLPTLLTCLALIAMQGIGAKHASWPRAWLVLVCSLLVGSELAWLLYQQWNALIGSNGLNALQFFASVMAFGVLTIAVPLWNAQSQMRAVQVTELKHAALAAQLKALQAQVEPHFLYNTLANARYLTRQDPQRATQMLDHLIAYLRSALPDMRSSLSTLGREFELAEHYLALMEIRFGERLHFSLQLADDLRALQVPPSMLMTLVENAVQHGVEPHPGEVEILVTAQIMNDRLQVLVRDDGAGLQDKVLGSGVGLRNLRERLHAMYGPQASFSLRTMENGHIEAELTLPMVRPAPI